MPPLIIFARGKTVAPFSYHVLVPAPMINCGRSCIPERPYYEIRELPKPLCQASHYLPAFPHAGLHGLRPGFALPLGCGGNAAVVSDVNASLQVIEMGGTARKRLPHQQARG